MSFIVAPNSVVEDDVSIGQGTKIWYFSHVRARAKIGRNCNIGDHVYIGEKAIIGDDCKIGNGSFIPEGVIIKDGVFIGVNVTFTNVHRPKAKKKAKNYLTTIIEEGASLGAKVTIIGGIRVGKNAVIYDHAVVVKDVPDDARVAGRAAKLKEDNHDQKI